MTDKLNKPPSQSAAPRTFSTAGGTLFLPSEAERGFDRARRGAFIQDALAFLRYDSPNLLPFEAVRERLGLGEQIYRGVQEIPLAQIAGSVGRVGDFTRAFLPRTDRVRSRWQAVQQTSSSKGMKPIQVYQVGLVYFVLDGNHRVSVARQAGWKTIQAHVWEFETRVPLEPDDALEDVLIRQEYLEFLNRTKLDQTRPDIYMILTQAGRYREFEEQIAIHRHYLELDGGKNLSFQEAAVDWYDNVYRPMVEVIHQRKMLTLFPGRTEADLVNWIIRNQAHLRQRYGMRVEDLASGAAGLAYKNLWQRFLSWFRRKVLRWPVFTGERWHQ